MQRLRRDAARIVLAFQLPIRSLEAERRNVKRRYGMCDEDGNIRIRLQNVTTGRPLKYSSLVNTLCHELAHLRHFDHGEEFRAFYASLLKYARREGIYSPAAPAKPEPTLPPPVEKASRDEGSTQLSLFG